MAPIRLVLAAVATITLGFADSGGCGYVPDDLKGVGEPCTRSSECQAALECRGGVCMSEGSPDAGLARDGGFDAGGPGADGGFDAGGEAERDAGLDAAAPDADVRDADGPVGDGSVGDGGAD